MALLNEERGRHSLTEVLVAMRNLEPDRLKELFGQVDKSIEECLDTETDQLWFLPLIAGDDSPITIDSTPRTAFEDLAGIAGCMGAIKIETSLEVELGGRGSDYYLESPYSIWVGAIDLSGSQTSFLEETCWDPDVDLKKEFGIREDSALSLVEGALNWITSRR